MGTVELSGRTEQIDPLVDPIYGHPCVYYAVQVTEKQGKHSKIIYDQTSDSQPFYLVDDTGRVPVYPAGAKFYFEKDINMTTGFIKNMFSSVDPSTKRFIGSLSCSSSASLSIEARIVARNELIYVLGYAAPADAPATISERVSEAGRKVWSMVDVARKLKSDRKRMAELDENKDGTIDAMEWDQGLQQYKKEIEQAVPEAKEKESPRPLPSDSPVVIRKSPEGLLVLADKQEREFISQMDSRIKKQIVGGPILTAVCLAFLAFLFGFFDHKYQYDPYRNAAQDIQSAISTAQNSDRRILLEVGGDWCIWCQRLEEFLKNNPDMRGYLDEHYVIVKVNVSPENPNQEVLSRYPPAPGVPHFFVLDKNGTFMYSQPTDELESGETYDQNAFLLFLKKCSL